MVRTATVSAASNFSGGGVTARLAEATANSRPREQRWGFIESLRVLESALASLKQDWGLEIPGRCWAKHRPVQRRVASHDFTPHPRRTDSVEGTLEAASRPRASRIFHGGLLGADLLETAGRLQVA